MNYRSKIFRDNLRIAQRHINELTFIEYQFIKGIENKVSNEITNEKFNFLHRIVENLRW